MVSPLNSPRHHSTSQSRPTWLPSKSRLREILLATEGFQLSFSDIGRNKNGSGLIDSIIRLILQEDEPHSIERTTSPPLTPARPEERDAKRRRSNTSLPDVVAAKLFLAIEVQEIIKDLAMEGLRLTEESSVLMPAVEWWSGRGQRQGRSDSIATVRGKSFSDIPPALPLQSKPWVMSPTSIPAMTYSPLPTSTLAHIPTPLSTPRDTRPPNKRKFESDDNLRRLSDAAALVEPQRVPTQGAREGSEEENSGALGSQSVGKAHKCPYFVRDKTGRTHPKCADRTFPNPRKLKYVLW